MTGTNDAFTIELMNRLVGAKALGALALMVACALVLWVRQTDDALLAVDSFLGAVAEVSFWSAPTLVLFVVFPRRWRAAAVVGGLLTLLLLTQWWRSATDWHSTAGVGPAVTGWFYGPVVIAAGTAVSASLGRRRAR